jgi:hypothetical protein
MTAGWTGGDNSPPSVYPENSFAAHFPPPLIAQHLRKLITTFSDRFKS